MRSGSIRHPAGNRFIRRWEWQLQACESSDDNYRDSTAEVAAEILSIMEWHFDNRWQNDVLNELITRAMKKHGKKIHPFGDWIPYSLEYLSKLLFGSRGRRQLSKALERLEQIGFISSDCPVDILEYYGKWHTWFKLDVEVINKWIDLNVAKVYTEMPEGFQTTEELDEKQVKKTRHLEMLEVIKNIQGFYRHIHAKDEHFIFDDSRNNLMKKRYRERYAVVKDKDKVAAIMAQAVLGNLKSEYHQGRGANESGKVYDDVEYIIRDAKAFEKHLGYAEDAGITLEIAKRELEAFLSGKRSMYAKERKTRSKAAETPKKAIPVKEYSQETVLHYRRFAAIIATILPKNELVYVIEQVRLDDNLEEKASGIIDAELLEKQLLDYASMIGKVSDDLKVKIKSFSDSVAEWQIGEMED